MDVYSQNFTVTLPDVGTNNSLTNKGFLRMFQEIGAVHSSKFGYGLNDSKKTGLFWIILNWKLEVFQRPKWNEVLSISTWCTHHTHIYFYRDYQVCNSSGEVVAIATSKWILFDFNKKSVFRITENFTENYCKDVDKNVFNVKMVEKFKEPENDKLADEYTVLKRDIDSNHHVNNLNYLDFAYEILPDNIDFKNVEIMYKNEARLGDILQFYYTVENNCNTITIKTKDSNKLNCIIRLY